MLKFDAHNLVLNTYMIDKDTNANCSSFLVLPPTFCYPQRHSKIELLIVKLTCGVVPLQVFGIDQCAEDAQTHSVVHRRCPIQLQNHNLPKSNSIEQFTN